MSKSKTKRSLLASLLTLAMCVTMLVGTTFAWFTDSASTSVNKIEAGKLDIDVYYADVITPDDSTQWKLLTNDSPALSFLRKDGDELVQDKNILWEPNCTYSLPALKIVNNGNLALKYKIIITGIQGDNELNDVIEWTMKLDGEDFAMGSEHPLLPNAEGFDILTIQGHMDADAGNKYQGMTIEGVSITVIATQDTVESDSKDSSYDEKADYPAMVVNGQSYDTLAEAIENAPDGSTILLMDDVELPADYILSKGIAIKSVPGQQHEIKGIKAITGDDVKLENVYLNQTGTLDISGDGTTLTNCTIRAKDLDWDWGNENPFESGTYNTDPYNFLTKVTGKNVTLIGCQFDGRPSDGSYFSDLCLVKVDGENITMKDCGFYEGTYACANSNPKGTWTLDGCKFERIYHDPIEVVASANGSTVIVNDCDLVGCSDFNAPDATLIITNCRFGRTVGHNAAYYGLYIYTKNATISNCSFTEDYMRDEEDRFFNGIYIGNNVALEISGCSLAGSTDAAQMAGLLRKEPNNRTGFVAIDAAKNADGKYISGTFFGYETAIKNAAAAGCTLSKNTDGTYTIK